MLAIIAQTTMGGVLSKGLFHPIVLRQAVCVGRPSSPSSPRQREGLNREDPGIMLLGKNAEGIAAEELLLVHCGDIPGVLAPADRLISDVREESEAEASPHRLWRPRAFIEQQESLDGGRKYQLALCWPRAHLGKDFSESCLAMASLSLAPGGRVLCAVRKQKGAKSLAKCLEALHGNVKVIARDRGYHLLQSVNQGCLDRDYALEILGQSYEIQDELFADKRLKAVPGVFSRKEIDEGTRSLIHHCLDHYSESSPARLIDLCAGIGPLSLWAALHWHSSQVLAIESNLLACEMTRWNIEALNMTERVEVKEYDGLPRLPNPKLRTPWTKFAGQTDLLLCNPPTHLDPSGLKELFGPIPAWLRKDGCALFVVNRPHAVSKALENLDATVKHVTYERFTIIEARWREMASV